MYSLKVPDERKGHCYHKLVGPLGRCQLHTGDRSDMPLATRSDCCCSTGAAWGPHCERCPPHATDDYRQLCGSWESGGYDVTGRDIDECRAVPGLCRDGRCVNTLGSYRCICNKGYRPDQAGTKCLDVNECEQSPGPCKFSCANTAGGSLMRLRGRLPAAHGPCELRGRGRVRHGPACASSVNRGLVRSASALCRLSQDRRSLF
ncbi:hypothetical protein LSTR_LSTR017030, partial [Laodelphax striatellus]